MILVALTYYSNISVTVNLLSCEIFLIIRCITLHYTFQLKEVCELLKKMSVFWFSEFTAVHVNSTRFTWILHFITLCGTFHSVWFTLILTSQSSMTSVWFVSPLKNNIALRIEWSLSSGLLNIAGYVFSICSELFVLGLLIYN